MSVLFSHASITVFMESTPRTRPRIKRAAQVQLLTREGLGEIAWSLTNFQVRLDPDTYELQGPRVGDYLGPHRRGRGVPVPTGRDAALALLRGAVAEWNEVRDTELSVGVLRTISPCKVIGPYHEDIYSADLLHNRERWQIQRIRLGIELAYKLPLYDRLPSGEPRPAH